MALQCTVWAFRQPIPAPQLSTLDQFNLLTYRTYYQYVPCTEVKCVKRESEITPSWVGLKPVVKSSSISMTQLIHPIRRPGLWQELFNSLAIPVSIK